MNKTLSEDSRQRLAQALSTWCEWKYPPESEPDVKAQLGGHTNESFHIGDAVSDWVVRLNTRKSDAGINRNNEILAIEAASSIGLAPAIAYSTEDFLIIEYLEGDKPTLQDIPAIGQLFSRIHGLDVNAKPMDLPRHLSNYYDAINPDPDISGCFTKFNKLALPGQATQVLCHQDMTVDNLLKCECPDNDAGSDKQIFVIDWEFTHLSDPAYDLAVFSYTSGLKQAQLSLLLDNYARQEENLFQRIRYYELFYALIEILWWFDRGQKLTADIERLHQSLDRALAARTQVK